MSSIIFYEKPGCATNARQKKMLEAAGHNLAVKSLLTESWTKERLLQFFGDAPVHAWFNPAAPAIKSGVLDPTAMDSETALAMMIEAPILIRRPLLEFDGHRYLGFDLDIIGPKLGLQSPTPMSRDPQACSRPQESGHPASICQTPSNTARPETRLELEKS